MLKLNKIMKKFDNHLVLAELNLEINQPSIVGLAGGSGSGKSTLLRCIQGLEKIEQGEIHLKAKPCFMFQDFQLFPHLSVLKNLTYAPTFVNKNKAIVQEAISLLDKLGLKDKQNAYPGQLSGGQKQRVALARALMMNPSLLLCDEPTSGLDVVNIQEIAGVLKKINAMGVSMIIASHDLEFLMNVAERIIFLKNGRIALDVNSREITDPFQFFKEYY